MLNWVLNKSYQHQHRLDKRIQGYLGDLSSGSWKTFQQKSSDQRLWTALYTHQWLYVCPLFFGRYITRRCNLLMVCQDYCLWVTRQDGREIRSIDSLNQLSPNIYISGIIYQAHAAPARSVGFWQIKKIPYQASPTQLVPRKCTF